MPVVELKLSRPWARIVASVTILGCCALLFRCGTNDQDKKESEGTTPIVVPVIPGDWNGNEDWAGSQWKVTDE